MFDKIDQILGRMWITLAKNFKIFHFHCFLMKEIFGNIIFKETISKLVVDFSTLLAIEFQISLD